MRVEMVRENKTEFREGVCQPQFARVNQTRSKPGLAEV